MKPKELDFSGMTFHAGYMDHHDGHVGNCRHFDQGSCNCQFDVVQELAEVRQEMNELEAQIAQYQMLPHQFRMEIARIRSMIIFQRKSLEFIKAALVEDVLQS